MQQSAYINTIQMDDIIRDSNGGKITSGDRVNFYCKMDGMVKEGLITKVTGGTFGIKCSKYIVLYKYNEVDKHMISKID
tara:strand:- start:335 stop:571 length:237 start_codon:yes stop_codon:yes gene_type:complete